MITSVTIGNATLYLGACEDILPSLNIPMNSDWQLCTDPPYVINTSGGGHFRKKRPTMDKIAKEGLDKGFDHAIINPLQFGGVVVFCHHEQLPELLTYIKGHYRRHALCFWRKPNPMPVANKSYQPDGEFYIHAWNPGHHPCGELKDKKRVTDAKSPQSKEFGHPTTKPLSLMRKIMVNLAPGPVIDPFMGTGTTGVAAIEAGRKFIGIEKNEDHFRTAVQRIKETTNGIRRKADQHD